MRQGGQRQEAGADSHQWQVSGNVIINHNMDPEKAHELMRQISREEIARYSAESQDVANSRIEQLEGRVIQALEQANVLGGLSDPSVQVALRKAQMSAASTEREDDYDILAGLIKERVVRGGERTVRAGINRAIEIVDLLDADALRGMTLLHVATTLAPQARTPEAGITTMEAIASAIVDDGPLPTNRDWLEHLDILNAIRLDSVQKFKPFVEYWPQLTPGYVSPGIPADDPWSENVPMTLEAKTLIDLHLLVDHRYKPGFKRIAAPNTHTIEKLFASAKWSDENTLPDLLRAAREYFHVDEIDQEAAATYMQEVQAETSLGKLADWWGGLSSYCAITMAGTVLARSNARRLHPKLPRLDAV